MKKKFYNLGTWFLMKKPADQETNCFHAYAEIILIMKLNHLTVLKSEVDLALQLKTYQCALVF